MILKMKLETDENWVGNLGKSKASENEAGNLWKWELMKMKLETDENGVGNLGKSKASENEVRNFESLKLLFNDFLCCTLHIELN